MINKELAQKYCRNDVSLIENYELALADTTQVWDIHHRAEILPCGIFSAEQLKKYGLYYNVPASQLIFLTHSEHCRLHGLNQSKETRAKISAAMNRPETRAKHSAAVSGENNPMFGKIGENHPLFGKHLSEEHRAKISAKMRAAMNRPETLAKISAAVSGENNPMFGKKHSEETRQKMRAAKNRPETLAKISAAVSAASKGRHWFNNGVECRFCKECPGDGWQRGRLRKT